MHYYFLGIDRREKEGNRESDEYLKREKDKKLRQGEKKREVKGKGKGERRTRQWTMRLDLECWPFFCFLSYDLDLLVIRMIYNGKHIALVVVGKNILRRRISRFYPFFSSKNPWKCKKKRLYFNLCALFHFTLPHGLIIHAE